MAKRKKTVKQQRLIDSFAGNIKEAAEKAEISYGYARQLLTKPNMLEAIQSRQDTEVRRRRIATRQERQRFWTRTMTDESVSMGDRLRASELLGKSEADFVDVIKSEHTMRLQLGAPRTPVAGQTTVDAEFEPARLERSTELDHETV